MGPVLNGYNRADMKKAMCGKTSEKQSQNGGDDLSLLVQRLLQPLAVLLEKYVDEDAPYLGRGHPDHTNWIHCFIVPFHQIFRIERDIQNDNGKAQDRFHKHHGHRNALPFPQHLDRSGSRQTGSNRAGRTALGIILGQPIHHPQYRVLPRDPSSAIAGCRVGRHRGLGRKRRYAAIRR